MRWGSYSDCIVCIISHLIGVPMVNHKVRLSIVIIHEIIIQHEFSMLTGYWVCVKINRGLWPMGEILMWLQIPTD